MVASEIPAEVQRLIVETGTQLLADMKEWSPEKFAEMRKKQQKFEKDLKLGLLDKVSAIELSKIKPSPENNKIYKPINPKDPEIIAMGRSIVEHGVMEPLVLSVDHFILSGHRRYAASKLAGLEEVPCRICRISHEHDPDEFLVALREYNRQRDKSFAEKLREEVISVDPHVAYQSLLDYREEKSKVKTRPLKIRGHTHRCKITEAKKPMMDAIDAIVWDMEKYWPITDRRIHYELLNDPPLKHASKPDSIYQNDKSSYNALTELLTRARLVDLIPMEAIADETRPISIWRVYDDSRAFLREELEDFLQGYRRNLMQSQPNHIEIMVEKNTVASILKKVAGRYGIPLTSGRGFCSLRPRYDMAERFEESGNEKLIILMVTDLDPDGEEIAASFARSLRDDFDIDIHPIKVALTPTQVKKHNLPHGMLAKKSSTNYKKFVRNVGHYAYELEALRSEVLMKILSKAIDDVIDTEAFNDELAQEEEDAADIQRVRSLAQDALSGIDQFDSDDYVIEPE